MVAALHHRVARNRQGDADADAASQATNHDANRHADDDAGDDGANTDHRYQIPSCIFTSSLAMVRGSQGGFQTIWTSTSFTPGISRSLA